MSVFVIAEAGVNHNGQLDRAFELIDAAVAAGADAVKFQTFRAEKIVQVTAPKASYQKHKTGAGNQFAMLKKLEMSEQDHLQMMRHCERSNIEFMSTPFDEEAAEFLLHHGMKRIKIPSGEITNHRFLSFLAGKNTPMIMSTGMATMSEITQAVEVISKQRAALGFDQPLSHMLTILHCTSNSPAAFGDVNLRAMATIAKTTGMPAGYSDHTLGIAVSAAAVALGACVIEKHFTLDNTLEGPDHAASLEPRQLAEMVQQIREIEVSLGSAQKAPTPAELDVKSVARRSITSTRDLKTGELISEEDISLLRPADGISPQYWGKVVGSTIIRDVAAGTSLQWSDIDQNVSGT